MAKTNHACPAWRGNATKLVAERISFSGEASSSRERRPLQAHTRLRDPPAPAETYAVTEFVNQLARSEPARMLVHADIEPSEREN
jgi:hypothetical protein